MSSAATNLGAQVLTALKDFWELTNFSPTNINLTGYRWRDSSGSLEQGDSAPFDGLVIEAGDSIIFVESDPTSMVTAQQFRDWWGTNLRADLKIILYDGVGKGLNSVNDSVRLWGPDALGDEDVIDRWDFGLAERGRSFVYNAAGEIVPSERGLDEAFKAATRDDIGSPGHAPQALPAVVLVQPVSLLTCTGLDPTLTVLAGGIPRPRYQWFRDGAPIMGATAPSLAITNVQPIDAGKYSVMVSNVLAVVWSDEAELLLDTNSSSPAVWESPRDTSVVVGDTAVFSSVVCALPAPSFQWHAGGMPIPGETNRSLVLPDCQLSQSGMTYCLRVENALGSTSVCARLTVTPRPRLQITELMSAAASACPGVRQEDWFELTNEDTFEVNLRGYRFASAAGDFNTRRMFVVTNDLFLGPGRSAIFVRHMDRASFVQWWGAGELPPELPVITFSQFGLNDDTDELYCWSPGEQDRDTKICYSIYSSGIAGVSKHFDCLADTNAPVCFRGEESVPGDHGAFKASSCDDIGSPGYTTNPPPRLVWIARDAVGAVTLRWRAIIGRNYQLKWKSHLTQPVWNFLGTHPATNWVNTAIDSTPGGQQQRFYIIEETP